MKKLLPFALLLLIVISLLGYYPVFLLMRNEARHEMKQLIKAGLPEEKLTRFVFDKQAYNKLDWEKEGEFRLNGEMYDVVRQAPDEYGNTVIYCINDKKETALFSRLDDSINDYSGKAQTAKGRPDVLKILSSDFLTTQSHRWKICNPSRLIRFEQVFTINRIISEVLLPPPEV